MTGLIPVGTVLPIAGYRAVHELGIHLAQGVVSGAQAFRHARAKALDEDVCAGHQASEHILGWGVFQLEGEPFLVAVDGFEAARVGAARVVAGLGALHLDHPGAHVRQDHGAEMARQHG